MLDKSILIVERNEEEAAKLIDFFKSHDICNKIEIVHTKTEAMEYVFQTGTFACRPAKETPCLIIVDLATDRTHDIHLLKPLRLYLRTNMVPIIILTLSEKQEDEIKSHALDMVEFFRKPMDFKRFFKMLERVGFKI